MIKLIATIDSARGLCNFDIHKAKAYETKIIATTRAKVLRKPLADDSDIDSFFLTNRNLWVVDSSKLYEQAIMYADQLFITQVSGIFACENYFPAFENNFILTKKSRIYKENGFEFQYQIWTNRLVANIEDIRETDTR